MATGAGKHVFIDTNVLVYASQQSAPFHAEALSGIQQHRSSGNSLWISRQVLREYLATLSKQQTFSSPLAPAVLADDLQRFQAMFRIAEDSAQVTEQLVQLIQQVVVGGSRIHDANIVATMLTHGITHLLTHNVNDFKRFAGMITIEPLVSP